MGGSRQAIAGIVFVALLALLPVATNLIGQPFYVTLMTRVMVFAIAAASLNVILSFGGMVSFGHAVFLGLGSYVVAVAIHHGVGNGFAHFGLVIVVCGAWGLLMGAICLRTGGLYFIMITLAFAQSLYFVGVGLRQYGGDDGLNFRGQSDFGGWLNLGNSIALYYVVWAVLVLTLYGIYRMANSRFGVALRAIRSNERRVRTLGLPAYRYKLAAFVMAGVLCGVSGALLANLTQFATPTYMHWTRSGELMIMVVLGGMGTVFGPLYGATLLLMLEEVLSSYTEHWQVLLGPILVILVLFAKNGVVSLIDMAWRRTK